MYYTRFQDQPEAEGGPDIEEALRGPLPFLPPDLTPSQRTRWKRSLRDLAGQEGGAVLVRSLLSQAPEIGPRLPSTLFLRWTRFAGTSLRAGPEAGLQYAKAAPQVVAKSGPEGFDQWLGNLERAARFHEVPAETLEEFLRVSPLLASAFPPAQVGALLDILTTIPPRPAEMSLTAIRTAAAGLPPLGIAERAATLEAGSRIAASHPWSTALFFQTVCGLVPRMAAGAGPAFIQAVGDLTELSPLQLSGFLKELNASPRTLHPDQLGTLLPAVARLGRDSLEAAQELLSSGPGLFRRLTPDQIAPWSERGREVLKSDEGAAVSFFRMQSRRSQETMAAMSAGVALEEVREVLELYSQALMGRNINILASEGPDRRTPVWLESEELGFDSPTIFAPSLMFGFPAKEMNFEAYKVLITHQTGHITFGTYDFTYEREGNVFRSLRLRVAEPAVPAGSQERGLLALAERAEADEPLPAGDLDRFFSLFQERRLVRDLFTLADDERIDALIREEYRGIRRPYQRVQTGSLEGRPPLRELALREYLFELLVRHSLGHFGPFRVPQRALPTVEKCAGILSLLTGADMTPEDVAEAAFRLYVFLKQVPNIPQRMLPEDGWVEVWLDAYRYDPAGEDLDDLLQQFARVDPPSGPLPGADPEDQQGEEEEEEPFVPPPPVPHRGEHQPELMQLMMSAQGRHDRANQEDLPTTAELIQELMEREELEQGEAPENEEGVDYSSPLNRYLRAIAERDPTPDRPSPIIESVAEEDVQVFHYDEWDYRTKSFRSGWCELHQRTLKEGPGEAYERTLKEHQWLAHAVRKQFEMLRPEGMGRVKRLLDGEEFDLDAVVESVVDKKAGDGLKDKIYWRRRKTERSVAVALLLDMSLSTDERIDQDARFYSGAGAIGAADARPRNGPGKRIIDLEKESLVLLMEALDQLGDDFAIYGFSSAGRGDIQFFVIKDMQEASSYHVRNRLDKIVPLQGTRMGAAIRHASTKLEQVEAHTKVLLLVSDGRPQDRGYGTLPWELEDPNKGRYHPLDSTMRLLGPDGIMSDEKDYAVHDTKSALNEARDKGITPFCLSIDKEGHDYLKAMCGDIGYEVVSSIEALPRRLPALYRRLTT